MTTITADQSAALRSILYAWALAFAPHVAKIVLLGAAGYQWDNRLGRQNMSLDSKQMRIRDNKLARARRAESAHQNGNESWPLYAVAILAAITAGLDGKSLNSASRNYLMLRAVYNVLFIIGENQGIAALRTLIWGGSAFTSASLIWRSATFIAAKTI